MRNTRLSAAVLLLSATFLTAPAVGQVYTPTLGNNSAFTINQISETDYDETNPEMFVGYRLDGEGKPVKDFYRINLRSDKTYTVEYKDKVNTREETGAEFTFDGGALSVADGENNGNIVGALFRNNVTNVQLTGTEKKNTVTVRGGGLYNEGVIENLQADFIGNNAHAQIIIKQGDGHVRAYGGAIYNSGYIENIEGDFIGNKVNADSTFSGGGSAAISAEGGAVYNEGWIDNIKGDFISNQARSSGGAITIAKEGYIEKIEADFINNSTFGLNTIGGAISVKGEVKEIYGNFINNTTTVDGGAIVIVSNGSDNGTVGKISGNFIGNNVKGYLGYLRGGAIAIRHGDTSPVIDADFINNYAVNTRVLSGADAQARPVATGGAIDTSADTTFVADNVNHVFSGNYTLDKFGKEYNALFVNSSFKPTISFNTAHNGQWIINDSIKGGLNRVSSLKYDNQYNLSFSGDGSGTIWINNDIINADSIKVENTTLRFGAYRHDDQTATNWNGHGRIVNGVNGRDPVTSLSLLKSNLDLFNHYQDTIELKDYLAASSFVHLDVDVENLSADMLKVNGDVAGTTKLILYPNSNKDIRGQSIVFATSQNDTTGDKFSFVVSRVYTSPYMFDVVYHQLGEGENQWSLVMNEEVNPDADEKPDVPEVPDIPVKPTPAVDYRKVAPEVIAYQGLPVAALEQTKGMIGNIGRQVQNGRVSCEKCGVKDYYWNGKAYHTLWANVVYQTSENEALVNVDADVWGIEAGGDLQHDLNNKLGLFVSYRKGNYDMNGKGKYYYSTVGSEIDIDSYLAGLYYRYDRNHWWTFATVYGGIQRVDLKTKDGIKSDTDGTEFGGSVELGYDYNLSKTLYLTPSVGAFYTQLNYGDASDSAGKTAEYGLLRQLELEAGVKLTKAFVTDEGYANVYVKPSVVQTLNGGDEVKVSGLREINTLDDQTLGRIELGGRYGFTEQLSAYGWGNHTFGDDYKASTFGLGLSYSW